MVSVTHLEFSYTQAPKKMKSLVMCTYLMGIWVGNLFTAGVNFFAHSLTGAKYWLTGDLGDEWGTNQKGSWVVVSFDPATTKEQRDALAPMILKTYGLEWGELKVQEAAIEITRVGPAGAPSSTADGNTENAWTNARQNAIVTPGSSSGR